MINDIIDNLSKMASEANAIQDVDYICEGDGLIYCGKCHTPKETLVTIFGKVLKEPCMCECATEKHKREAAEIMRNDNREDCFCGSKFIYATFDKDDRTNKELSRVCGKYAEKFSESSDWLLLYGNCGTGKSFSAACACNELINKGFSAKFSTVGQLQNEFWDLENKTAFYNKIKRYDLLCIDDLGAERESDYMQQFLFDLIECRLNSGKPCIITTNLTAEEFSNPKTLALKRIYSRIFEKSILYHVKGDDRRLKKFKDTSKSRIDNLLSD